MLLQHRFSTRAFEIRDFLIGTVSIWVLKKALKKFYTNPHVASVFLAKTFTTSFFYGRSQTLPTAVTVISLTCPRAVGKASVIDDRRLL